MPPDLPRPKRPLLFLDYDGTLAPIVDDPARAFPHPDVPDLLRHLQNEYPVYVVTGRDLETLARLLPGVNAKAIGLHGVEVGILGVRAYGPSGAERRADLDRLRTTVPTLPGITVEDKGRSFAVHYRNALDEGHARRVLEVWAARTESGLKPIWGKKVVEFRPSDVSKGTAATRIANEHLARTPVYLGDDVTDEDAFRALNALSRQAVTIKVGAGETAARHRLPDVDAVVEYLRGFLPGEEA